MTTPSRCETSNATECELTHIKDHFSGGPDMVKRSYLVAVFFLLSLCFLDVAYAQWAFLARRALGRIEHLASPHKQGQTHEMATVLLEADATKVYKTAVNMILAKKHLLIDNLDETNRTIAFNDAQGFVSMKVVSLGDHVCQIMIGSTGATAGEPTGTSLVVDTVLRVCKKMNVTCSLSKK